MVERTSPIRAGNTIRVLAPDGHPYFVNINWVTPTSHGSIWVHGEVIPRKRSLVSPGFECADVEIDRHMKQLYPVDVSNY